MDLIDAEMTRLIEHKRLTTEDIEFNEVITLRERLKMIASNDWHPLPTYCFVSDDQRRERINQELSPTQAYLIIRPSIECLSQVDLTLTVSLKLENGGLKFFKHTFNLGVSREHK
jgi:hypothetical protein